MVHVPYRGAAPAVADLLAGHVQIMLPDLPAVLEHIRAGRLTRARRGRPGSARRSLPDTPTMVELRLPARVSDSWYGLIAPAGMPPPVLKQIHDAAVEALRLPEVASQIDKLGATAAPTSAEEFRSLIEEEQKKWKQVIQTSGVKLEYAGAPHDMDYDPRTEPHNLARDPVTSLVVPRPIGWITTITPSGLVNLAPYSFFNLVAGRKQPFVMFSSAGRKHTQRNAEIAGEFVFNLATFDLRTEMNQTSAELDEGVSEPEVAGLAMVPSRFVKPPRVALSPIALECKYNQTVALVGSNGKTADSSIVIGEVVNIHVDDSVIVDGMLDIRRMRPIARLGYMDYCVVDDFFTMLRPVTQESGSEQAPLAFRLLSTGIWLLSRQDGDRVDLDQVVGRRHLADLHHRGGGRRRLEIFAPHFVDQVEVLHVADIDVDAADVVERAAGLLDGRLEVLADLPGLRFDVADAGDRAVGAARRHARDEHQGAARRDRGGVREMSAGLADLAGDDLFFGMASS